MSKILNGISFASITDAELVNYGDGTCWLATGISEDGEEYNIRWEYIDEGFKEGTNDFGDCADWENPFEVEIK